MANLNMFPPRARNRETFILNGAFTFNGAGAVNNALNVGLSFEVTRTGVGFYTIQFVQRQQQTGILSAMTFPKLLHFSAMPLVAGASAWVVTATSETVATDGKINFLVYSIAGAALADPAAGNKLHFSAELQNASTV